MVVELLRAAHVGPSAVVTLVVAGLGVAADVPAGRLVVLLTAVLAGQFAIGWCNDLVDAGRDRIAGRTDKPLATHQSRLTSTHVTVALVVSLGVTVGMSLALGMPAGAWQLVLVASGLAYDLGLKATPASAVPYAVGFSLLPVFTVAARGDGATATWWAIVAGGCFGVGVHLANAVPDLAEDAATGVRGLPQRLGRTPSLVASVVVLVAGCVVVVVGTGATGGVAVAAAVALALLVTGIVVAARRGDDELAYRLVMALGLATVGVLLASGGAIVA